MFKTNRKSAYPILDVILNRWAPRAFALEQLSETELMTLFEAARWAPSSFNNQPWRFIYAWRGSEHWSMFLNLLVPSNAQWAQHASVLACVISKKTFDYDSKPSRTHSFDTGAAALNMALQGASMDIVVHGMEGFDYDRARTELQVPEDYTVEAMFALGKHGSKESLPPEIQKRENPSDRKPLSVLVSEGSFLQKSE